MGGGGGGEVEEGVMVTVTEGRRSRKIDRER